MRTEHQWARELSARLHRLLAALAILILVGFNGAPAVAQPASVGPPISPYQFGALCNGTTSAAENTALQAWANALTTGAVGVVPGVCAFNIQLVFPVATNVSIIGMGRNATLLYTGTLTTGQYAVTIGSTSTSGFGCSATGLVIQHLKVVASLAQTVGTGLLIGHACYSDITDLEAGGVDTTQSKNWYDAVQFYGGNTVHMRGYSFTGNNIAEIINGDETYQFTDMYQTGGTILFASIGLDIAGNVGGMNVDDTSFLDNGVHVQVDESQMSPPANATANSQIFFGKGVALDVTNPGGIGFNLNDAYYNATGGSWVVFTGTWIASAQKSGTTGGQCIYIQSIVPTWTITMSGGMIHNCQSDAIRSDSSAVVFSAVGTRIGFTQGYGFNQTVANPNIQLLSVVWEPPNPSGNYSSYVTNVIQDTGVLSGSNFALNPASGQSLIMGPSGGQGVWVQNGLLIPGNSAGTTAGGTTNVGSSTYPFSAGTFNSISADTIGYVGGAGTIGVTNPIQLPRTTVSGLGTCSGAAQQGILEVVTDASSPTWGATLVGGGSTVTLAMCNGSAWTAR